MDRYPIGTRVVVNQTESQEEYHGQVGIVIKNNRIAERLSQDWDYEIEFPTETYPNGNTYVFIKEEIDLVYIVGRQLHFSFS